MIDLASPSTGGSSDVISGAKTATGQTSLQVTAKDAFKNNLVRAAKNSAVVAQLQMNVDKAASQKKSASLRKQIQNHQVLTQKFIT